MKFSVFYLSDRLTLALVYTGAAAIGSGRLKKGKLTKSLGKRKFMEIFDPTYKLPG
jgi:hypothetical protein